MAVLYALFYLLAVICFVLAAFSVAVRKINLIALGLAFFVLVFFLKSFMSL